MTAHITKNENKTLLMNGDQLAGAFTSSTSGLGPHKVRLHQLTKRAAHLLCVVLVVVLFFFLPDEW